MDDGNGPLQTGDTTMTYTLHIAYKTDRHSKHYGSYKADIYPSEPGYLDALSPLTAADVVENNVLTYRGVYASEQDAVLALINYLKLSLDGFVIMRTDYADGRRRYSIADQTVDLRPEDGEEKREVLFRRSKHGEWTSSLLF